MTAPIILGAYLPQNPPASTARPNPYLVAKDRRPFGLALRRWRHVDEFIHVLTGG